MPDCLESIPEFCELLLRHIHLGDEARHRIMKAALCARRAVEATVHFFVDNIEMIGGVGVVSAALGEIGHPVFLGTCTCPERMDRGAGPIPN